MIDEMKQYSELCRDQHAMMVDMERELAAKDIEIARLREIAQDRTAQIGWMTSCHCGRLPDSLRWDYCDWSRDIPQCVRDGWNTWAAKELQLETAKDASYIDRLEAAFLAAKRTLIWEEIDREQIAAHYQDVDLPWMPAKEKGELVEQEARAALAKIHRSK